MLHRWYSWECSESQADRYGYRLKFLKCYQPSLGGRGECSSMVPMPCMHSTWWLFEMIINYLTKMLYFKLEIQCNQSKLIKSVELSCFWSILKLKFIFCRKYVHFKTIYWKFLKIPFVKIWGSCSYFELMILMVKYRLCCLICAEN